MIEETTVVTGQKFICDILRKEVDEKDVFAVQNKYVVSKEAANLFPEHLRDVAFLCKIANNCYCRNMKKTGWVVIPDDGYVRTQYNNDNFKSIEECYSYAGMLSEQRCHIFYDGKFVETVTGNPVKCGDKIYGRWLEVTPWIPTTYYDKVRCGLAEVVNMPICGLPFTGKILLRHERGDGELSIRDYYTALSLNGHSIHLSGSADKEVTHA